MTTEHDILYLYLLYRIYKRHKRRRVWVNPANKEREKQGILPLYPRLVDDVEEFYVYTKMSPEIFDDLCTIVSPEIRKMNTNFREAIPARDRLLMTLRFLSSGESLRSLSCHFRIGTSTIRKIVYETCEAIWKRCHTKEIPPLEEADFKKLASDFENRWDFPNCVGCVVGKKIRISSLSSSQRWDVNKPQPKTERRSVILQGVADAHGNFVAVDVGDFDRQGDSGPYIFRQTSFGKALMNNKVELPFSEAVDGSDDHLPYVFITSISYPMLSHLLRPFPKRDLTLKRKLFNEKLAHAHKCSELAFGTLVDRWGVLKSAMNMDPSQVCKIVRACCILHNFVRHRTFSAREEDPEDVLDILPSVTKSVMGRPSMDAMDSREHFADYFFRTQPTPSFGKGPDDAHEPLLELECQEDETTPMEEQEYNDQGDDQFDEFAYPDKKNTEDSKMEAYLNFNQTKPENDMETDDQCNHKSEKPHLRNWQQTWETELSDIGERPHPVLQFPSAVQPSVDADEEIDVKPEIIHTLQM